MTRHRYYYSRPTRADEGDEERKLLTGLYKRVRVFYNNKTWWGIKDDQFIRGEPMPRKKTIRRTMDVILALHCSAEPSSQKVEARAREAFAAASWFFILVVVTFSLVSRVYINIVDNTYSTRQWATCRRVHRRRPSRSSCRALSLACRIIDDEPRERERDDMAHRV